MSALAGAADALRAGRAVVIPTDTVYGLAASLHVAGAIEELFRLKGRPREKAIPILGANAGALERIALFDERARRIAAELWPGPLTLVLARAAGFDADLGGTSPDTVAVRVPAHPLALELLALTGPLGVTSANLSGVPPLTTAAEAARLFGSEVDVLDGGTCGGEPSTVLDLTSTPRVLRAGAVDAARLHALMS